MLPPCRASVKAVCVGLWFMNATRGLVDGDWPRPTRGRHGMYIARAWAYHRGVESTPPTQLYEYATPTRGLRGNGAGQALG